MNIFNKKIKGISKRLKEKTTTITIDIEDDLFNELIEKSNKLKISVELYINYMLYEYMFKEESKKYPEFDVIKDNITFQEFLKDNKVNNTTLVIDYLNPEKKFIAIPEKRNNYYKDTIEKLLSKKQTFLNEEIDTFLFTNHHIDIQIKKEKRKYGYTKYFIASYVDELQYEPILKLNLSEFSINECYNKVFKLIKGN